MSHTNLDNIVSEGTNNGNVIVDTLNEEVVTDIIEIGNHDSQNVESAPYILPPRSTRGVPPRRYDTKYEAKRSRYLIENSGSETGHRVPWHSRQP